MCLNKLHALYRSLGADQFGMVGDKLGITIYQFYVPLLWEKAKHVTPEWVDVTEIDKVMFTPDSSINVGVLEHLDISKPIIVMGDTNIILDGNHRFRKLKCSGHTKILICRISIDVDSADIVTNKIFRTFTVRKGFWKEAIKALAKVSINRLKGDVK